MKFTLAPIRIVRDHDSFMEWWQVARDREDMIEALDELADSVGVRGFVEHALQRVTLEVFQESGPVNWLQIRGIRPDAEVREAVLDFDPSYNTACELDGLKVVLTGTTEAPDAGWPVHLRESVYVDKASALAPESFGDVCGALAEILDTVLEMLNDHIACKDRFITAMRILHCSS